MNCPDYPVHQMTGDTVVSSTLDSFYLEIFSLPSQLLILLNEHPFNLSSKKQNKEKKTGFYSILFILLLACTLYSPILLHLPFWFSQPKSSTWVPSEVTIFLTLSFPTYYNRQTDVTSQDADI